MADEIKLKAPTVEQQVVVNINGEEKLRSFADTLEKISNNKNLQKYWKTQQELINATADAYGNFSKKASQDNAKELVKVTNALKAMAGTDLSNILPDFDKISKAMAEAQKVAGNIDSAFSVKGFKEAFDSFETLKAYGVDIQNLFSHFGVSSDVGELQKNVRSLEGEVEKLTRRLTNAKNANEELRNEFDNFKSGSGFADKLDELDNLKSEMSYLREQAEETFRQFLKLNNITEDGYDRDGFYDDNRFKEYFQNIQSGYMSASDAIRQFKTEYSYLLEDSFKSNNDTFGLEQLQSFSNKLDSIFRQVEETSTKINDIISNGVITKSVENLSMDSSLSDSQRSLFGNLLQDEESLKSITALFQKLIEESNKTSKVDLFNDEQLQQVLSIFDKIEGHLSSLRSIISDVGDGEEFSPLLSTIDKINTSIKELSTSVKGIGLNMNIDVGSDDELDRKLQTKVANALQAYQKLFNNIKMSSAGGSFINQEFFDFNLDNYDTAYQKLKAIVNFIKKQRTEAKKQFNGYDALYEDSDKSLWKSAQAYLAQVTKAETEIKKVNSGESNPLENLFGNTKDLSEVIEQLNKVVEKLNEISSSATEFKNIFKEGFNVTTSVEEIDKLTNRVKELEDELAKIKLNPASVDKSNISSGTQIKDVFQGDDKVNTDASTAAIKKESQALEQVSTSAKDAATSKEKFANANKEVKASADSSTPAINKESDALKSEWDKNVKAIQDYMDAVTKLNNLNAKDKGTGKYSSQIALQEKNVEELKEKALEARTAITSMINPHDVPLNTWRDYLDVMKKFDQASLGSAESVAKLEDALRKMDFSSLESAGTKFESQFKNLSIKPDGDHQFLSWTNDLKELNAKIDEYNSKVKYLKENNIVDGKQVDEVKNLRNEIKETINAMSKTPQAKRGWTDIGASKAAEKVANVLKQNTKMSKEARDAIRAYYNELRSGNPSQPIDEILVKVNQLVQKERELGRVGKSFGEIFKEKVIYGGAAQLAGMVGFYDVINVIRQAGEAVIDLNTNITELAKVSEASVSQIYDDFNSYADIAKEVGGTISDTISATADWSRNGYNIPDAKELAEVAMIYKNVGDGIDIDQANEYLISTLRGFSLEAKDAMDIIDSINEVANNEPISSAGIGEALQRSAAAFNVANTSLQESIALVTSTNSVLQSPEKVGSMWTTVSARIRGAKTELEDAGLETDGMVESTSKLQAMIKGMTGFDILEDDQKTFKSIYDIIIGIGEEFQNLSGVDQAALLEALAGKRQSNALAATLNNIDLLKKAYGEATNAEGSAMAEQEKYQQSIQYSIDRTKASLEELANDFISSDFLKGLIDSGDKLINLLDLLIDKFGVLGTAAGIGGIVAGFKNIGREKCYPSYRICL